MTAQTKTTEYAELDDNVAILFSDIENSTSLTERLGDRHWLEVLRSHNRIFRGEISRHGGYEVKSQGDGFMLAFGDPRKALACAVSVQRALAERELDKSNVTLRVRMGLHMGEVIAEEGDFFGKNVILAARIAAKARGGEILVSEELHEAATQGNGGGLRFHQGRALKLKGLAGHHRVFRAEWGDSETAASVGGWRWRAAPNFRRGAVRILYGRGRMMRSHLLVRSHAST